MNYALIKIIVWTRHWDITVQCTRSCITAERLEKERKKKTKWTNGGSHSAWFLIQFDFGLNKNRSYYQWRGSAREWVGKGTRERQRQIEWVSMHTFMNNECLTFIRTPIIKLWFWKIFKFIASCNRHWYMVMDWNKRFVGVRLIFL